MICPKCGRETGKDSGDLCPFCGSPLSQSEPAGEYGISPQEPSAPRQDFPGDSLPPPGARLPSSDGPPWEHTERPFFGRLFETAKDSMFNPVGFFKNMRIEGGFTMPLLYILIFGTIGGIFSTIWNMIFQLGAAHQQRQAFVPTGIIIVASIFLIPLLIVVSSFVSAGIMHLLLMILGGASGGYEATYRAIC